MCLRAESRRHSRVAGNSRERWLGAFHLRLPYTRSQPQNAVLYIPARGWFRELHKRCVEARGQHASHTLAAHRGECTWCADRGQAGACKGSRRERALSRCAYRACVRACRCTLRLHAFHAPRSLALGPCANEIPCVHAHIPRFTSLSAAELRLSRREQYLGKYRCCTVNCATRGPRVEFERVEFRDAPGSASRLTLCPRSP